MSGSSASTASFSLPFGKRTRFVGGGTGRAGLAVLCILVVLFVQIAVGGFVSWENASILLTNITAVLVICAAAAPLLISGNVDLSIGGTLPLASVVMGKVAIATGSTALAITAAIGVGILCGLLNGVLVRVLDIAPIIVTLATGLVFGGVAYVLADGVSVFGFPAELTQLGVTLIAGIPVLTWIALVVFLIVSLVLTYTVAGLRAYAMGGNPDAARNAGVATIRYITGLYVLTGAATGLAAFFLTARLNSGSPAMGVGYEIDVLTAIILGGVGFAGGTGRMSGVFLGVVTIAVINAGMVFVGISSFFQTIVKGGLLLVALGADQLARWIRTRRDLSRARLGTATESSEDDSAALVELLPPPKSASDTRRVAGTGMSVTGLAKSYGAAKVLSGVDANFPAGQVTCIVGDNGAGKSTLVKMLSGVVSPDEGSIALDGGETSFRSPADARRAGIETVYQDLSLAPNLGAAANMVLGREPRRGPNLGVLSVVDRRAAIQRARARLAELQVTMSDVLRPTSLMSGGQRQSVSIAKLGDFDVKVAILDEPTAALGVTQSRNVARIIRRLADRGVVVIVVSHDLEQIQEVADRVVVLRLGSVVYEGPSAEISRRDLVLAMAGLGHATEEDPVPSRVTSRT